MNIRHIKYLLNTFFICCIHFIYCTDPIDVSNLLKSNAPSEEMIESLRKEIIQSVKKNTHSEKEFEEWMFGKSICKNCNRSMPEDNQYPRVLVFMSFSVPSTVWISLSKELQKVGGCFVIRGLPNNSFKELSQRLIEFAKLGMESPVQLDPIQFTKYHIETVPSFVINHGHNFHKISGNITLEYAMTKLEGRNEQ